MARFIGIQDAKTISGAAVVVDVMRAFTVAPWALSRGAEKIILVETLDQALELKATVPGALALKDGPPADGFDLLNSPAQILEVDVAGRVIIQRTTAGTQAVVAARRCVPLLCASFVCASATAEYIRQRGITNMTYVVSGSDGAAAEDRACAQFIDVLVETPSTDPRSFVERAHGSVAAQNLRRALELGYVGVDERDIEMCLDVDRFDFVLEVSHEDVGLVLRRDSAHIGS